MQILQSRSLAAVLVTSVLLASTGGAQAWVRGAIQNNTGPIVIDGPVECEKKLVLKCRWVGDRKICEWVPGPDCEIY